MESPARTNPFPGLRPFESNENHLFFGRDGQSQELLRRLRQRHFVAVVGTSGSGKSSLVRAGLLPALYGGFMIEAGSGWRVTVFRPGNDPVGNLATALNKPDILGALGTDPSIQRAITETTLRRSSLGLIDVVRQARIPAHENLLIVVDQFEEVFRFKQSAGNERSEDEAAAFVKLLLEAIRQKEVPIYVVLTMRSDFLGDCAQFRDLPETINDSQYLIPRMTRDQRREAITGPVAVGGAEITPRLLSRLLNDVGDNPDHLPILQHTLMRVWQHWVANHKEGDPVDLPHYEAVGGMADALSRHADKAYNELPDERSKEIAEKLFKRLTERGPDNREVRHPSRLEEICAVADAKESELIAVIESFRRPGRSFLMPPSDVPLHSHSLIDISHESLIRGWKRLKDWVDGEALSAGIYRRVAETAMLYKEGKAGLWRDPDLQVALGWREKAKPNKVWAARYHQQFEAAMEFLDASRAARDAETLEREKRRRKDLRRAWLFATILGLAFTVTLLLALYANTKRLEALAQTRVAQLKQKETEEARREAVTQGRAAMLQRELAQQKAEEAQAALRLADEQRLNAVAKQKEAEEAKRFALEQAALARQQAAIARQEKERAETLAEVARQETDRAQKLTNHIRQEALRLRKRYLNDHSMIVFMADKLIELSPPQETDRWRTIKAASLTLMGNHEEAIAEFSSVLDREPENLAARLSRSYEYLANGEAERSIADLNVYLKSDPYSYVAHLNMGHNLGALGRYDEAAASISQAIKATAHKGEDVFQSEIMPDIVRATGYRTLSLDKYSARTAFYYELANLQAYAGGAGFDSALREADTHFTSLEELLYPLNWTWLHLKKRPEDYGAYAGQGALWERIGLKQQALLAYTKFQTEHARRKPQGDHRYDALAQWVERRFAALKSSGGSQPEAREEPEKIDAPDLAVEALEFRVRDNVSGAWEQTGSSPDHLRNREAKMRALYERLTRGIEAKGDSSRSEDDRVDLLIERTNLRFIMKDYAGAREDSEEVLRLAPKLSAGYVNRAFANMIMGLPRELVIADFQKAIELDPVNADALLWLSRMVSDSDPQEARKLLERSIGASYAAQRPQIYYQLAQLENKAGNYAKALKLIEAALEGKSDNADFYEERARAERGLKKSESEVVRRLSAGYNRIGDTMLKLDRTKAALVAYGKSLDALVGLAKNGSGAELRQEIAATAARISQVILRFGTKAKAIEFWETALASGRFKGYDEALQEEIKRLRTAP